MAYPLASTALRPSTLSPTDGSRTITITADPTKEEGQSDSAPEQNGGEASARVLRLRGAKRAGPRVAWDDDVVDNEHMGKKKSKICCIYHKPRQFDESSSEDESSDSDNSSCGGDAHHHHKRNHNHHHKRNPHQDDGDEESGPNAYERPPRGVDKGKGRDD
ncbi:hypothetical protein AGABI1DRAFT_114534 [Agaricus bisporus var. burnettii JB137-S8]|uniref:Type 1 phosphatases regulator n=1 Tax=Agaricus bisporus var. burnettii (strain JB137-S8 / ATCC MYA-4627 / FGSC 10392) TaxID=597362 RepID=K5X744_AGABU|nr:uncharacterized protein AGABI1DRAFT_114534 [Agaricus bisporus var. burnettii JB137-S8]EKM79028.1 hypothetical protein AGABI1DRAFT_114534 [Agaricus bisporus var. burnettii JB137-S8]